MLYTIKEYGSSETLLGVDVMKTIKKATAALLICALLICLSACLKYNSNLIIIDNGPATTAFTPVTLPPVTEVPTSYVVPTTDPFVTVPTTLPTDQPTMPGVPTTVPGVPTTEATTAAPSPATWSKQEIVSYYVNAANKTKAYTNPVTVHHVESFTINIDELSPNLPALKSVAQSIINSAIKPVDETLNFANGRATSSEGEDLPLLLPKRQNCALTADGVVSARAAQEGANIVIELTLVREVGDFTTVPKFNAATTGYLDASMVDLSAVTVDQFEVVYSGSTVRAVIRPDGYIQSAQYNMPIEVTAAGKALKMISASVVAHGAEAENWEINW